ncbi:1981_t:CDS:2, partial [Racocetra persica]
LKENCLQKHFKVVEEINRLKEEIKNYKAVSTTINIDLDKFPEPNYNFQRDDDEILNHNLHLEYKRLVAELKKYKKNNTIFRVVNNYKNTKKLYKIGL